MSEEKEIIIDGVDVSECRFFQRQYIEDMYESDDCNVCIDDFCTICFSECAEKDCYYKQLTRLQKENEKLKDRNANLRLNLATYDLPEIKKVLTDWRTGELDKKFKNLQKENEELKKQLEFSRTHKTVLDAERIKYKQALEQIRKEYTNSIFYQCDKTEKECPCHNCIILGQLDRVQNIVKIIDEVLNDRNKQNV